MKKLILTFLFISAIVYGQTTESEPNDTPCEANLVEGTGNSHQGTTIAGDTDCWIIPAGSTGKISNINSTGNIDLNFEINYMSDCNTVSSLIYSGEKPPNNIQLDPNLSVVICITSNYPTITNYSVVINVNGTVLPVELTSFNAKVTSDDFIELSWVTATEINNYGFDIQRQYQNSLWETMGFVEGYGNSNSPKYYSFRDQTVGTGDYAYRLKQIDLDGQYELSDVVEISVQASEELTLNRNYPNPFNPTTVISYSIPNEDHVTLEIFDVLGNKISQLENGYKSAGNYSYEFDATKLTSGIYFYTLKTSNFVETKKMLLMK